MLEITRLEYAYPGTSGSTLRFDLAVSNGEVLSLIGPSGSGKSTLLNLVAGFLAPASGHILLDGVDIVSLPAASRPVSIVFQQHNLFPHLDLYTNVALGIDPSLRLTRSQAGTVAGALERLGLDDLQRRKPGELSGGQRQRAALARVLVRRRKILLLDEAFAALGPAQRAEMIGLVKNLVQENDMTALLVSHQPRDALIASRRCAFVSGGRITVLQPTRELLEQSQIPDVRDYLGSI
ncbi:MAG: ATP-binding cassette domain-containing protein [Gammaproteobacteria bacterium]|nr:ATP-binding cassette domain-containing protein [Gammaproteobacteria bacterium]MDH3447195.1 ATP-binding cassette domain-containing protein [Gammaproteobacteria bacterium]